MAVAAKKPSNTITKTVPRKTSPSKSTKTGKTSPGKKGVGTNKDLGTKKDTSKKQPNYAQKKTEVEKVSVKQNDKGLKRKLMNMAKIERIPDDVISSIPFKGVYPNGVIETRKGHFTRSYELEDVNFRTAHEEEQMGMYIHFCEMLNSFDQNIRWQFNIINKETEKINTLKNLIIPPQKDGLNVYRKEMSEYLTNTLADANNSVVQSKYLTLSIEDNNVEHAMDVFHRLDVDIEDKIKRITEKRVYPLTGTERLKLLHDIYNQDYNEPFGDGTSGKVNFKEMSKYGLNSKMLVAPTGFMFKSPTRFMVGDMYGSALYLSKVPTELSTEFIGGLSDLQMPLLVSITGESMDSEEALKFAKRYQKQIRGRVDQINQNAQKMGYSEGYINMDLRNAVEESEDLIVDLTKRNQSMYFASIVVVTFSRTIEGLEDNVAILRSHASKNSCKFRALSWQQEAGLNTALPLCRNDIWADRLFTSEQVGVFIPFTTQTINQKNSIFYGTNQETNSMVMYDRLTGDNFNGLVFGASGSGKSFTAKTEMISVLLSKPNAQVFVIDPQGEYSPLIKALHGTEIKLAPGSGIYINPLDMTITKDDDIDPVTMKADYILSMIEVMAGKGRQLDPACKTIIDRCVRKIYKPYIEYINNTPGIDCDKDRAPTLAALYHELRNIDSPYAEVMADILELYAVGSFDTFAHRTNVETDSKFVVYNIESLGTGMKELGIHICLNDIWDRMIENNKKDIYTWFYIDEFHVLLESDATTLFCSRIWKMARKWKGVPTGILQNTADLLRSVESKGIVSNTNFMFLLKGSKYNRQDLQELLSLSPTQVEYIHGSDRGCGLVYTGSSIVPVRNKFPKDTKLYELMDTSDEKAKKKKAEMERKGLG